MTYKGDYFLEFQIPITSYNHDICCEYIYFYSILQAFHTVRGRVRVRDKRERERGETHYCDLTIHHLSLIFINLVFADFSKIKQIANMVYRS